MGYIEFPIGIGGFMVPWEGFILLVLLLYIIIFVTLVVTQYLVGFEHEGASLRRIELI